MKKSVLILTIVLVLMFLFTITASATKPTELSGYFYDIVEGDPMTYCVTTFDIFLYGCVIQPYKPGLNQRGTFYLTVGILSGTCEYNLRAYDIDGIARFVANRCTGDLAGFHMKGVGSGFTGLWEGSYHFDP